MRIFLGFLVIALGALMVIKSEWIFRNFGRVQWAEEHLGSEGGTRLFIKLMGLLIIVLSLLYITGTIEGIITFIFLPQMR